MFFTLFTRRKAHRSKFRINRFSVNLPGLVLHGVILFNNEKSFFAILTLALRFNWFSCVRFYLFQILYEKKI